MVRLWSGLVLQTGLGNVAAWKSYFDFPGTLVLPVLGGASQHQDPGPGEPVMATVSRA